MSSVARTLPLLLVFALIALAAPSCTAESTRAAPQAAATGATASSQSYHLSPEKYQQAVAFSRARYRLYFIDTFWNFVVLLLVLELGWSGRFRDFAERFSNRRLTQGAIYQVTLVAVTASMMLPTALVGHWLQRKYAQSIQSWPSWFWDWVKGQMVFVVIAILFIWIFYSFIRRSPRRWWLYFWFISLPLTAFFMLILPVVIDPIFNRFSPLDKQEPELTSQIQQVASRAGLEIPRTRIFEMKASEKMNSLNANVTGFGPSQRIVVFDTAVAKMTRPEILFVLGHEMGHYVLGHIWEGMIFGWIGSLIGLYLAFRAIDSLLRRFGARWRVRSIDDYASLPAFLLMFGVLSFLSSPLLSAYSRSREHQADTYGIEVIHGTVSDPQSAAADAFQVLGEVDLSDPNPSPFIKFWLFSHPPLAERIAFARSYDPWSTGRGPRFVK